jgi:DNA-binding response OmpR family regulator
MTGWGSSTGASMFKVPQRSPGKRRLTGRRILVVEDEFIIAMELQSILEEAGAQVVGPCHTLAEALAAAEHEDISAATLDLRLGLESAIPAARALGNRHIPFIYYSVQSSVDSSVTDWPKAPMIPKPAPATVLVNAIAQLLQGSPTSGSEHGAPNC